MAQQRAQTAGGALILRSDDLDRGRVRPEYIEAMIEDLRWLGLRWTEGPDLGGPFAPYEQSRRVGLYAAALERLKARGFVYPCACSRQDVLRALHAPHAGEEEPIYPGTCRKTAVDPQFAGRVSWRFRVPEGAVVRFIDGACGPQEFRAGRDFGDFVVWRHDDLPAYQLACVVDDALMRITEVVRGADLLLSTARQILLFQALDYPVPAFFHCPLMVDERGVRLAKRHDALSLKELRRIGRSPEALTAAWVESIDGKGA